MDALAAAAEAAAAAAAPADAEAPAEAPAPPPPPAAAAWSIAREQNDNNVEQAAAAVPLTEAYGNDPDLRKFFNTFMEEYVKAHGKKKIKLDPLAARDLARVAAGDEIVKQMSHEGRKQRRRRIELPMGIRDKDDRGNAILRKKSSLISTNRRKRVVKSLHRVDTRHFNRMTIRDLLEELRDVLIEHRATVLEEDLDGDQLSLEDRPITDHDTVWTILEPFLTSMSTTDRRKIKFLKECLLDDYIWRYVRGGRKGLISGLIRVVRASQRNHGIGLKVGSCNQDASFSRISDDTRTYPPSLFAVHLAWAAIELKPINSTTTNEEVERATRITEDIVYDLLRYVLCVGVGINSPSLQDPTWTRSETARAREPTRRPARAALHRDTT